MLGWDGVCVWWKSSLYVEVKYIGWECLYGLVLWFV